MAETETESPDEGEFLVVDTYRPRTTVLGEEEAKRLLATIKSLDGTRKAVVVGKLHQTQRAAHQYGQRVARQLQANAERPLRIQPVETDGGWAATIRYRTVKPD